MHLINILQLQNVDENINQSSQQEKQEKQQQGQQQEEIENELQQKSSLITKYHYEYLKTSKSISITTTTNNNNNNQVQNNCQYTFSNTTTTLPILNVKTTDHKNHFKNNNLINVKNYSKNINQFFRLNIINNNKNNNNIINHNINNSKRKCGEIFIYILVLFCSLQLNYVSCYENVGGGVGSGGGVGGIGGGGDGGVNQELIKNQNHHNNSHRYQNKNENNFNTTATTSTITTSSSLNNYSKNNLNNNDNFVLDSDNSSNYLIGIPILFSKHNDKKKHIEQNQNYINFNNNNNNNQNITTPQILYNTVKNYNSNEYNNISNNKNKYKKYNPEKILVKRIKNINENNESNSKYNENTLSDEYELRDDSIFDYNKNINGSILNLYNIKSKNNYNNGNGNNDTYYEPFGTHKFKKHKTPIYLNEFAVHVPAGKEIADNIASKYGFINLGQIGSLQNYYLFYHHRISKRSVKISNIHHSALNSESEVLWTQQQHEKVRKKRDYVRSDVKLSPLNFGRPSTTFGTQIGTSSLLRSIAPQSRLQYRETSPHNIFPDPLFKEQWYLNGGAKDGLDMNVGPAWQKGYTGKGVVVSILDDGIQTNHPDLAQNYDPDASYDINGNDSDPMPQDNGDNKHGTRCAGEVAAVAFNNYCGVGVAYNASIGGVRMLDGSVNDAVEAKALSLNPQHIDIYSASWGPEDDGSTVDGPGPLARRAFIYGVTSGRQGKGSIFVWASGNGGRYTDSCNCDGYTNSIFTLSISSATQGGFKPWYLEECSSTLATTYSSGTPGHDKSVATVDMDGRLRPDHICTVEHTGTSASAPLAAGICALALEANPTLTWRDMQYLVVMTSRPEPLEKEMGWILNGVKRKYSHKFGYGLMDAGAMVSLAEQWTTVPPQHICKSRENNEDRQIEGTYGYTLQTHMDVNGCAGTINEVRYLEHVQCKITLRFFPRGNLRILLTSPMGTTSTLLFERPRDIVKSNFDDWPFLSVHFWGEKAEGRWTLQVINGGRRRVNQPGILSKWQLIFYGTQTNPIRLKGDIQDQTLRRLQGLNPFVFPTDSDLGQPTGSFFNTDPYSGYLNYQNLFTGAGSNPEKSIATVDGHNIPTPQRQNVMADSNNKLVLHDCDPECDFQGCYGRGPTQCVACKHYRLDNTCVSRCPPRSFPNQGGVCWPCHESCETCAGAGQDSCLTCAPAHLHVTDLAVCLQVCPEGYYENYDNKTCVPCEANCASCQDRPDYCTSCDHHLVMHEHKCYSACPLHTYETEDYNCASCHPTCATCNGSSESQCITCRSGRFAFDGKCLNSCPDGYYGDKKRQECIACPTGCAICSSNGFCLTCKDNWTKNKKGKCIANGSENCDESEYYDNGHCHSCHSTCETCDGPTETNCLTCSPSLLLQGNRCVSTCDDGYYMEAGLCAKCLHTCTQCVSRMNCTACAKGLQLQSGECRTTCADGYYSDRGTCAKCYLSCHTCSGPRRDQCVQCPKGWQLAGGECHPECPEGFYKSEFGCQKCHHYCKTCNGAGPLACTSCPIHFMLDGGLCMECLGSQYYDPPTQTCKTCHESCRSCTGPGQYSCQTCAFPLNLDRLNNQCVPCCPTDASPDDQSCCHCDKDTGGCINASPAGKRRIAIGAEQQFGSENGINIYGLVDIEPTGVLSHVGSPLTTITAIAVAGCLLIITVFAVVFAILQRNSQRTTKRFTQRTHTGVKYNKLPTKSKKSLASSSSTTLQMNSNEPDDNSEEYDYDDDDDDDYNDNNDVNFCEEYEEVNNENDSLIKEASSCNQSTVNNTDYNNKNIVDSKGFKISNNIIKYKKRKNQDNCENISNNSHQYNKSAIMSVVNYSDCNNSSSLSCSTNNVVKDNRNLKINKDENNSIPVLLKKTTTIVTSPNRIPHNKINKNIPQPSSSASSSTSIKSITDATTATIQPSISIRSSIGSSTVTSEREQNRFSNDFISNGTQYDDENEIMIVDDHHRARSKMIMMMTTTKCSSQNNSVIENNDNDVDDDDNNDVTYHSHV